jgi:hypothetical protein
MLRASLWTSTPDDGIVVVKNLQCSGAGDVAGSANWISIPPEIPGVPGGHDLCCSPSDQRRVGMAEVVERVARLEERFDGMTTAIAELKVEVKDLRVEVRDLDTRMRTGFAELREEMHTGSSEVRSDMQAEFAAVRSEMQTGFAAVRSEMHSEMHTQLRWIMGGIGGALLATLLAVLGAVMALR